MADKTPSKTFTPAQSEAIHSKGATLVSAAAGSGKTTVLVERVMEKIAPLDENTEPVPVDRLLIVTFTKAAAAEMRGRIEKALYERIKEHPEKEYLKMQRHLLSVADICTIDSFCAKFVRDNFTLLGVSPDFSVSDGKDLAEKRSALLNGIVKPLFAENSPAFNKALQLCGCEYTEENFIDLIEVLFEKAMLRPFPDEYLDSLIAPYNRPFEKGGVWYEGLMNTAREMLEYSVEDAGKFCENAAFLTVNTEKYVEYGETALGMFNTLLEAADRGYDAFRDLLCESGLGKQPSSNEKSSYKTSVSNLRKTMGERLSALKELFLYSAEEIEKIRLTVLSGVEVIVDVCRRFKKEYFELCKEENVLTFSFCEQLAFKLINGAKNGEEQFSVKEYDEVMVDEYQDVNDLQDSIFRVLSNDGKKLFVVGDVKQSIYRFRGSNPENFSKKEKAAAEGELKKIFLSENFRSRGDICSAVNYFFSLLLAGQIGEVTYGEEECLKPAALFPSVSENPAHMLIVDNSEKTGKRLDVEGEAIADYIEDLMAREEPMITEKNAARKVKYGDIAIILRSTVNKAGVIAEALQKRGIPVSYTADAFLDSFEVKLVFSLLKVINNPESDVALLSLLMSPLFNFSADKMALIRAGAKRGDSLYSSLIKAADAGDGECAAFIKTLREYRRLFVTNTLGEALNMLYGITGICDIVSLMPNGDAGLSNLRLISRIASEYQAVSTGGIYPFLRYIENLPEKFFNSSFSGQSGVKIMSIHASKGLQFPVCILGNLSGKINKDDFTNPVLFDEEYGFGFHYYDDDREELITTVSHDLLKRKAKEKLIEEELRLLYVAATRAQDKLCMVCSLVSPQSRLNLLASRLSDSSPHINKEALVSSTTLSDIVLYCALLNGGSKDLRRLYDVKAPYSDSDYNLIINLYRPKEKAENCETKERLALLTEDTDATLQMTENFAYKYPFEALSRIEAKVSVSRLANGEEAERFAFTTKPSFMLEGGLSAAEAGTAMHHVMQYISFEEGISVEAEIERLKEWRYISEAEATAVSVPAVKRFFESDIYKSVKQSPDIRREMRFLTEVPASQIADTGTGLPEDAKVLVQGAVDLCFVENGFVTVLDFKTDKVDDLETLKTRYREQLDIYSKACEKIFNLPVSKRVIYSFTLSDYIVF